MIVKHYWFPSQKNGIYNAKKLDNITIQIA